MKAPSFWRGATLALVLSVAGTLAYKALAPLAGAGPGIKLLVPALGLAYLLALLARHRVRAGHLAGVGAWALTAVLLWVFDPALWAWLLAQTMLIWLLRCLYVHDSLSAALLDAGLNGIALAAALATAFQTSSLFLCLWSFFLVQALYVLIPSRPSAAPPHAQVSAFDQSERAARAALGRLATRPREEYPS